MQMKLGFKHRIGGFLWAFAVLCVATHAQAFITYTDLYTLSTVSGLSGINPTGDQIAAGGQVVGFGQVGNYAHAVVWKGPAGVGTDLNPSGYLSTIAYGVSGAQQIGSGGSTASGGMDAHALLWTGTAASAIDLTPPGDNHSEGFGTDGIHQVGEAAGKQVRMPRCGAVRQPALLT